MGTSNHVLEIVVFTVRAPGAFHELQRRTHAEVAMFTGYHSSLRLQGATSGLFADVVAWTSLEAAHRASAQLREDPRFAAMLASIERLAHYAHYRTAADLDALLDGLRGAPRVELAVYGARDPAAHHGAQARLHEALKGWPGYRIGAAARQVEEPDQFADLIGWESDEAQRSASAALQTRADHAAFFAGIGEMKVFERFTVVG
jgi:heme-degrading monooxygenase HmoA